MTFAARSEGDFFARFCSKVIAPSIVSMSWARPRLPASPTTKRSSGQPLFPKIAFLWGKGGDQCTVSPVADDFDVLRRERERLETRGHRLSNHDVNLGGAQRAIAERPRDRGGKPPQTAANIERLGDFREEILQPDS